MPKVSVIIPIYNAEEYLDECLKSVLSQTLSDIEVICVDDGSGDSSFAILNRFAKKDSRIKVIEQKNAGAGTARNNGMKVATGEYLSFLDSDDVFEPTMLEKLVAISDFEQLDVAVCRCNKFIHETKETIDIPWTIKSELIPANNHFQAIDIKKDFFEAFIWWPWDKLFRTQFIKDSSLYFQEQRTTNDLFFVVGATLLAKRIDYINDILIHQRVHEGSLAVTREKSWHCLFDALIKVRDFLQEKNLYDRFEQDFINYCVTFTSWHKNSINISTYQEMAPALSRAFKELGVADKPRKFFYKASIWSEAQKVLNWKTVAISVIMPSLNVRPYIRECVQSVCDQTLRNIEIICVDAGSTDGTLEILREFEKNDPRVTVIVSDKKSYGYQMNLGLKRAQGEYIGIVETDDFASPTMYANLFAVATKKSADVVKANWHCFQTKPIKHDTLFERYAGVPYNKVLTVDEKKKILDGASGIWSGIYRKDFLEKNEIDFLETPGASYQDTAFLLKVIMAAKSMILLKKGWLHYRIDNDNSSVHSLGKVFCVCDEMKSVHAYMNARPTLKKAYRSVIWSRTATVYDWNDRRLANNLRIGFLKEVQAEFTHGLESGSFKFDDLSDRYRRFIEQVLESPESYAARHKTLPQQFESSSSKESPLFTIVLEARNGEKNLRTCLDSLLAQTFSSFEVLCFDQNSLDNTAKILVKYTHEDPRFKVINNSGESLRNTAVNKSQGTYILFINNYTFLQPSCLELWGGTIREQSPDILLSKQASYNLDSKKLSQETFGYDEVIYSSVRPFNSTTAPKQLFQVSSPSVLGKVYRTSFLKSLPYRFEVDASFRNDALLCSIALLQASKISICDTAVIIQVHTSKERRENHINSYASALANPWINLLGENGAFASNKYNNPLVLSSARALAAHTIHSDFNLLTSNNAQSIAVHTLDSDAVRSTGIFNLACESYEEEADYNFFQGIHAGFKIMPSPAAQTEVVVIPRKSTVLPSISVVVPIYNSEEYLSECLDSLVNQSKNDIEIICVDDGSTDSSSKLIKKFAENDQRIILLHQENQGQSVARNTGVSYSIGRYIYFIDSDDILDTHAFEKLYEKMELEKLDVLFFEGLSFAHSNDDLEVYKRFDGNYQRHYLHSGVLDGPALFQELWNDGDYWVSPCMQMTRKEHFINNNLWFLPGIIYEDNFYTFKSLLHARRANCIHDSLYRRRVRSESTMSSKSRFFNCYSYFQVFLAMSAEISTHSPEDKGWTTACELREHMLRHARSQFSKLSSIEQNKRWLIPEFELYSFERNITSYCMLKEIINTKNNEINTSNRLAASNLKVANKLQTRLSQIQGRKIIKLGLRLKRFFRRAKRILRNPSLILRKLGLS